jgi:hypothetical protein
MYPATFVLRRDSSLQMRVISPALFFRINSDQFTLFLLAGYDDYGGRGGGYDRY